MPGPGFRPGNRGRRQGAQALTELALVLLFAGGLFVVVLDFGRGLNMYLVVVHASREAARVAMQSSNTTTDIQNAATTAASDAIPASALTVTCQAVTFTPSAGTYSSSGACPRTAGNALSVTVSTSFTPLLPFIGFAPGPYNVGGIPISSTVVTEVQS